MEIFFNTGLYLERTRDYIVINLNTVSDCDSLTVYLVGSFQMEIPVVENVCILRILPIFLPEYNTEVIES